MIPDAFIQDLLNRVDIVELVGRYVPLKRAGSNFVACCPFHAEKTPSFSVSPTKQFYHCFGCGAHGTAIRFLMEHTGAGFVEAVRQLADGLGMPVPEERSPLGAARAVERKEASRALGEVLAGAARHYREQLKRSDHAIAYLKRRGVSGEVAARFGLGYAPAGWQALAEAFADYGARELVDAGLVIEGDEGKRYDRFRDRIMFPIADVRGAIIGFGGRVLGAGEPKYLNSPETPLFEKGRELYGLYQARRAIRDAGRVLVVEGYMDVVALAQHGVEYAVATLGTATTPHHARRLFQQSELVVFSFDGDSAGRRAAWRALESVLPELNDRREARFLFLPEGEDPDSYIRSAGRAAFEERVENAMPLADFFLRELKAGTDISGEAGRARLADRAKPLLDQVRAPVFGDLLRRRVAAEAGVDPGFLGVRRARRPVATAAARGAPSVDRRLLKCLVAQPALAREEMPISGPDEGPDALLLRRVVELIRARPNLTSTGGLIEAAADQPELAGLEPLAGELETDWGEGFDVRAEFDEVLGQLRRVSDKRRRQAGWQELARSGAASVSELRGQLERLMPPAKKDGNSDDLV